MGEGEIVQIEEWVIIWVKLYSGTDIVIPIKIETKHNNREIQEVCETELRAHFPSLYNVKIFEPK